MREAIKLKYSLIRYYYTSLFDISTKGTGTFYKPMFFEFSEDFRATQNIDNNVMLGSAMKLSINSQQTTGLENTTYLRGKTRCTLQVSKTINYISEKVSLSQCRTQQQRSSAQLWIYKDGQLNSMLWEAWHLLEEISGLLRVDMSTMMDSPST